MNPSPSADSIVVPDRVADPERLAALRRTGLLDTPAEEPFDRLTRVAARVLDAPVAIVSLIDRDRQFCKSFVGLPEPASTTRELPLAYSMCQHVVASAEPLIVGDTTAHPAIRDNLAVTELGARAYAGIPLVSGDGHTLGSFCVIDLRTREWTADQVETLRDLAASVITEIELRSRMAEYRRSEDERIRLVNELEAERTRLRDLIMQAPAAISLARGPEHVTELHNDLFRQTIGGRDIVGMTVREAFPELEGQGFYELLDGVYSTGEPFMGRAMPITWDRSGTGRPELGYMNFTYQPLRDAGGEVYGILSHSVEVTDQVLARQEVERLEERYRALSRALAQIIWTTGPDGRVEDLPQWREYTGQTADEVRGAGWLDAILPEDLERTAEAWKRAVETRGEEPYNIEYRIRGADGIYRWFQARGVPVPNGDGGIREWVGVCIDVDARKRAEATLQDQEQQFRTLANSIPQLAWMADETGYIFWYNQRWYEYTGTAPEDVEGWGWQSVHDPDELPNVLERWTASVRTGEPFDMIFPLRGADGIFRPFLTRVLPVRDARGRITRWIGTNTDITEQRDTEERQRFLAEAGTLLGSSLDYGTTLRQLTRLAVPVLADWCAIDLVEEDGSVRRVEVAHLDPAREALAHELERRYPPAPDAPFGVPAVLRTGEPELVPEIPDELIETGARDEEHLRILRELALRSYIIVPLIARGRTLGAITLVYAESGRRYSPADLEFARDLARRAATAVDNARLFRDAEMQRTRLEQVFTEAPAVMALYSGPEKVVTWVNPTWERTVGKPGAVGKPFREVFPEFAGTGLFEELDRVYQTGEPYANPEVLVPLDRRNTGTLEETLWNLVWRPLASGPDGQREILVHAVEITEQVRARRQVEEKAGELARTARALEVSNRELDQFAYVASHDLKAPLRGIANLAQWIQEDLGGDVPEEVREHIELLHGRVQRMESLIDGILQYSRIGRVRDEAESVDVHTLLDETLELLAPPDNVEVTIDPGMPTLKTERLPLQQVFMNLIGNAIKYTPRPDAEVRVGVRRAGNVWEFSVADNGPGIAARFQDRIWGIFQILQARDTVEGTGIGLSLVKKIVESRGGRVWVESEEGAGATFRFTWPMDSGSERSPL